MLGSGRGGGRPGGVRRMYGRRALACSVSVRGTRVWSACADILCGRWRRGFESQSFSSGVRSGCPPGGSLVQRRGAIHRFHAAFNRGY
jgi:hypothetical protein